MAAASNDRPLSMGELFERFPDKEKLDVNEGNEVRVLFNAQSHQDCLIYTTAFYFV